MGKVKIVPGVFTSSETEAQMQVLRDRAQAAHNLMLEREQNNLILGNRLRNIRASIPHGAWTEFCERELGISTRWARHLIRFAEDCEKGLI